MQIYKYTDIQIYKYVISRLAYAKPHPIKPWANVRTYTPYMYVLVKIEAPFLKVLLVPNHMHIGLVHIKRR